MSREANAPSAGFLVQSYADARDPPLEHESVLDGLTRDEQRLHDSPDYERVVIWSEADCHEQLVVVRLLAHYATHRRPQRLELINVGGFPGNVRFVGLGQLPPEALRLLWATRDLRRARSSPSVSTRGTRWRARPAGPRRYGPAARIGAGTKLHATRSASADTPARRRTALRTLQASRGEP